MTARCLARASGAHSKPRANSFDEPASYFHYWCPRVNVIAPSLTIHRSYRVNGRVTAWQLQVGKILILTGNSNSTKAEIGDYSYEKECKA